MPHEGKGRGDNPADAGHNIIHGGGDEQLSSHVDRADKAAPLPQHGKGAGLESTEIGSDEQKAGAGSGKAAEK